MLDSSDSEQADLSVTTATFAHEQDQLEEVLDENDDTRDEEDREEQGSAPLVPKNDNLKKIFHTRIRGIDRGFRICVQDPPQGKRNLTLKVSKLKRLILDHGGEIVSSVVKSDASIYHPDETLLEIGWFCRRAVSTLRRIDVLHHSWIQACVDAGQIVNPQDPKYDCFTLCKIDREAPAGFIRAAGIQAQSHTPTNGTSRNPYTDEDRAFIVNTLLDEPTMHPQGNVFAELLHRARPTHSASSYQTYVSKNWSHLQLSAQMERLKRAAASNDLVQAPPAPPPAESDRDSHIQQAAKDAIVALTGGASAQLALSSIDQTPLRKWKPASENSDSSAQQHQLTIASAPANSTSIEGPQSRTPPLPFPSLTDRTTTSSGVSSFYPQQQARTGGTSAPAVLTAPAALSTPGPSPRTTPTAEDKLSSMPSIYQQAVAMGPQVAKRFEKLHFQGMSQVRVPESDSDEADPGQNQSEEESQLRSSSPLHAAIKAEDEGKDNDILSQGSQGSDTQLQAVEAGDDTNTSVPGQSLRLHTSLQATQPQPITSSDIHVPAEDVSSLKAPNTLAESEADQVAVGGGGPVAVTQEQDGGPSQDEQAEVASLEQVSSPAEPPNRQTEETASVVEDDEIEDEETQDAEDDDDETAENSGLRRRDRMHIFVGNSQYPIPEDDPEEEDEARSVDSPPLSTRDTAMLDSVPQPADASTTPAAPAASILTLASTQGTEDVSIEKNPRESAEKGNEGFSNFASAQLASLDKHASVAVQAGPEVSRKRSRDSDEEYDTIDQPADKKQIAEVERSRSHLRTSPPLVKADHSPGTTHIARASGLLPSARRPSKSMMDQHANLASGASPRRDSNVDLAHHRILVQPVRSTSLVTSSTHRVPSSFLDTARQFAVQSRRISAHNIPAERVPNALDSANQSADVSSSAHWQRRALLLRKMADWSQIVGDFGFRALEQIGPYMVGHDGSPQSTRAAIESHFHEIARHYEIEVDMVAKVVLECSGDVEAALKVLDEEQAVLDRRKRRWQGGAR